MLRRCRGAENSEEVLKGKSIGKGDLESPRREKAVFKKRLAFQGKEEKDQTCVPEGSGFAQRTTPLTESA